MIEMVKSERPVFHTFHRAWTACVGLPKYDKATWKMLEDSAFRADGQPYDPSLVTVVLRAIESLISEQGGTYSPV